MNRRNDPAETIRDADGKPMYVMQPVQKTGQTHYVNVPGGDRLLLITFKLPVAERYLNDPDYTQDVRPIAWPFMHPYWLTELVDTHAQLMAYVESSDELLTFWPEATELVIMDENLTRYEFTDDYPVPDWWLEVTSPDFEVAPPRVGVVRIVEPKSELSIIFATEDADYDVQLNNLKLEYGKHENHEFQQEYTSWRDLQIEFRETRTLEAAQKLAKELQDFDKSDDDGLQTNLLV